jgi:hypothetical protein
VAYAYSTDGGATWVKPELGVVDFAGSSRNNLVLTGIHGMHVALNRPDAPAGERYLLFAGKPNRAYVSPDGIRWTPSGKTPFLDPALNERLTLDSQNVIFWDTRLGRYVAYPRFNIPTTRGTAGIARQFGRAESKVFGDFGKFRIVFAADTSDPVDFDWYTTAAIQYPYAADAYFMFPAAYHHTPPPPKNDGPVDIQFACSRDGVRWLRPDRRPIISLGFEGAWNGGSLYAGYGLSRRANELSLYYTAYDVTHGAYVKRDNLGGVITRALYRLDGFMSAEAGYDGGGVHDAASHLFRRPPRAQPRWLGRRLVQSRAAGSEWAPHSGFHRARGGFGDGQLRDTRGHLAREARSLGAAREAGRTPVRAAGRQPLRFSVSA